MKSDYIMKKISIVLSVCLAIFVFCSPLSAQNINLSWDASPSDNVIGYKVYYSQSQDSLASGSGADEGVSPVDVGDILSAPLSNLDDDAIYYFAVTAYDSDGNESTYSNIVTSGWEPVLAQPANQETGVTIPTYVEWEAAPDGYDVSYLLFYGTDEQAVEDAGILPGPPSGSPLNPFFSIELGAVVLLLLILLFLGRVTVKPSGRKAFKPTLALAGISLGMLLTACGGGGGGSASVSTDSDSSVSGAIADTATDGVALSSVDLGTVTYCELSDLDPGTTYYWKVVAVDEVNTSLEYQSAVYSFTTAD